eukprot:scaffold107580_cov66-Phaeocystis_antarctica.AAC.8
MLSFEAFECRVKCESSAGPLPLHVGYAGASASAPKSLMTQFPCSRMRTTHASARRTWTLCLRS